MPTATDLLGLAIDKNPTDFAATFDEILRAKAEEALRRASRRCVDPGAGRPANRVQHGLP